MHRRRDETVLFLHLQKAAGNSLRYVLERQYPPQLVFQVYKGANRTIEAMPQERRFAFRLVVGHFDFGFHRFFKPPFCYLTMLRDPVERVISNYFWTLQNERHAYHDQVLAKSRNIAEYLESGIDPVVDNGMTKMLSGKTAAFGHTPPEFLELAERNLERFFPVVGLAERFDESVLLMRDTFGWGNVFYVRRNVTQRAPGRGSISVDNIQAIEQRNALDMLLYQHAKHRFEAHVQGKGPGFGRRVESFRRLNRWYGALYGAAHPLLHEWRIIRGRPSS